MRVFHKPLPALRVLLHGIVHVATLLAISVPPVELRVPVGLGEIGAYGEILVAERIEHKLQHIASRIVAEGVVGNRKVGLAGVEHAEAVVMLRGENHVAHAGIRTRRSPLRRIEFRWPELIGQSEVPVHVLLIGAGAVACDPLLVADRPRLHDSRNGIESPVNQHAELQVLPLLQVVHYLFVLRPFILRGALVDVSLCEGGQRSEGGQRRCGHDGQHGFHLSHCYFSFQIVSFNLQKYGKKIRILQNRQ